MSKQLLFISGILIPSLLLAAACGNPVWNGDVEEFVENGLSNMGLAGTVRDSDGSDIDYLTSNQETVVRVNLFNPKQLAADYTLTIGDATLYDSTPVLSEADYRTLTLPIDPTLAAEHQTLEFTLGIYVPSLNRTYPDQTLTFRCETAPNPPLVLMGGKTDNNKAMIAFQIPREDTDADIESIEIRWGPSGSEFTSTFAAEDASLLSPPPDGENLLVTTAPQNRYFYPASAAVGMVYLFNVTLVDAYGRRSETRSTASDRVEYSLTYDANNADSGSAPLMEVHEHGETATVADNTGNLARSGYFFGGWNSEADGTGTDYAPGDQIPMDSGNRILYAKWSNYTVTYANHNPDVTTPPPAASDYLPGDLVTVPGYAEDNLVDVDYFLGWDTDGAATTVVYESGDAFTMGNADIVLHAVWADCIYTEADLIGISDMDANYYLMNDIPLQNQWTTFIGDSSAPFNGRFFGNGHTISNLEIRELALLDRGLFGYIGSEGEIHELNVTGIAICENCATIGLLAGWNEGLIENCTASGRITNNDYSALQFGGLVGRNDQGSIMSCSAVVTIVSDSGQQIGGLVGNNESGIVSDCTANVDIANLDGAHVGGLVGHNSGGTISDCTVEGLVSGYSMVGGIAGYTNSGEITGCYMNATIDGVQSVGGIAGITYGNDTLFNCSVTGDVIGIYAPNIQGGVGGLVGFYSQSTGSVRECRVNGDVIGQLSGIGGLFGYSYGVSIDSCRVEGSVRGAAAASDVGGLIGRMTFRESGTSTISNCSMTGSVEYYDTEYVSNFGGLIGSNVNSDSGTLIIENSYNSGPVNCTSPGTSNIGGLIGSNLNFGTGSVVIRECFSLGEVNGYTLTGGLIGETIDSGSGTVAVERCFAAGNVIGEGRIGGLIAHNENGSVSECYAAGDIVCSTDGGGLISVNIGGTIRNCYAAGDVNGYSILGGLIANNNAEVVDCYCSGLAPEGNIFSQLFGYNTQDASTCYYRNYVSLIPGDLTEGIALTGVDLRDRDSYDTSWDFDNVWDIDAATNGGYPYLRYFLDEYGVIYQ